LIITDHHEITGDIPDTTIINPKMPGNRYPWRELSGSGVVLKLVCALYERMVGMGVKELVRLRPHYWAFASLGTISDRCPLIDENRLIVRNGLTFLQSGGWPSLEVWLEEMGLKAESLTVFDLYSRGISAFYAADAEEGVRLLLSDNQEYLHFRYAELKERATAWQRGKQRMIDAAERTLRHTGGMVISTSTDVGQDYLGTAAHALRERYGKPVIVIVPRKEQWHAECRGLDQVNLLEYLSRFERFFLTFGGHRKACGFTLRPGTLDEFLAAVDAYPIRLPPSMDEEKAAFELAVTTDFTDWALLAPFGEGNLPPRLVARGVELSVSPDGYSVDRVPIYLPFSLRPLPKSEGRFDMEYTIKPDGAIRVLSLEPVD
jgi:single-stranded-DNA-specific exonuclease